jgi:hypothetical protein
MELIKGPGNKADCRRWSSSKVFGMEIKQDVGEWQALIKGLRR